MSRRKIHIKTVSKWKLIYSFFLAILSCRVWFSLWNIILSLVFQCCSQDTFLHVNFFSFVFTFLLLQRSKTSDYYLHKLVNSMLLNTSCTSQINTMFSSKHHSTNSCRFLHCTRVSILRWVVNVKQALYLVRYF